ncbi:hypothetical protein FH966_02910 [Lentibacillus cibarius]|uniref:Uncharacterized protein n=1 Tax=Lentibacillus cibarius TaxID=2583219 RepID=A0A549YFT4_9BACI|nr:hypothetical protein [Lentibacillus cibarius]TRM10750.1 hypothetical protein FH966_02910 [Lentibacillus cibarius]
MGQFSRELDVLSLELRTLSLKFGQPSLEFRTLSLKYRPLSLEFGRFSLKFEFPLVVRTISPRFTLLLHFLMLP